MDEPKIVLYSTGCPMCEMLKRELKKKSINFDVCSDMTIMAEKGIDKVPILEVDNNKFDTKAALNWMKNGGVIA